MVGNDGVDGSHIHRTQAPPITIVKQAPFGGRIRNRQIGAMPSLRGRGNDYPPAAIRSRSAHNQPGGDCDASQVDVNRVTTEDPRLPAQGMGLNACIGIGEQKNVETAESRACRCSRIAKQEDALIEARNQPRHARRLAANARSRPVRRLSPGTTSSVEPRPPAISIPMTSAPSRTVLAVARPIHGQHLSRPRPCPTIGACLLAS